MAGELLTPAEHARILEKLDGLPFGDRHAAVYRASLEELFKKFNGQLAGLFETIKAYREVADLISKQQPLVNKKKYVRVRMRNGGRRK
ncbi:hypothetical protein KXD93_04850 [Mucilaginibacter sp. BJC16-A38]|uniref:hypothetical protein n=1 Tax=Mucilaginibacter phenanthrenivorans TaxID=1234842 RepID=UPI0021577C84|nr:hypothetical protein [Mucilaginibacter phenanthrenivorans]MCR8556955.1 hypothetical protein [Mucilaginibacter phenanthrenivorans]